MASRSACSLPCSPRPNFQCSACIRSTSTRTRSRGPRRLSSASGGPSRQDTSIPTPRQSSVRNARFRCSAAPGAVSSPCQHPGKPVHTLFFKEQPVSQPSLANGQKRLSLNEQLDRLDHILDGLAESINETVVTAIRTAVHE